MTDRMTADEVHWLVSLLVLSLGVPILSEV